MSNGKIVPFQESDLYAKLSAVAQDETNDNADTAGATLIFAGKHWRTLQKAADDFASVTNATEIGAELISAESADDFVESAKEHGLSDLDVPQEVFSRREVVAANQATRDADLEKFNSQFEEALEAFKSEWNTKRDAEFGDGSKYAKLNTQEKALAELEESWLSAFVAERLDNLSAPELLATVRVAYGKVTNLSDDIAECLGMEALDQSDLRALGLPSLKELTATPKLKGSGKIAPNSSDFTEGPKKFVPRIDDVQYDGVKKVVTNRKGEVTPFTFSMIIDDLNISREQFEATVKSELKKLGVAEADYTQPPKSVLESDGRFHLRRTIGGKPIDISWIPRNLNPENVSEPKAATPAKPEQELNTIEL